jgi:amino acid adenylation domain-containing protein
MIASATETLDLGAMRCVHETFEEQAAARPEAVAVTAAGETLTYGALNARANQVARALRRVGVGPETCVGLQVSRTSALAVGIVGILKAGGAYVPLEPSLPAERRGYLARDARVAALVTDGGDSIPAYRGPVVNLADRTAGWAGEAETNLGAMGTPDRLAYVIYTSGSTGEPKGVGVTHANVARLFTVTQPWWTFGPDDVWTLFHAYAFDFSVWELWGALLFGGRVVIVPETTRRALDEFWTLVGQEGVTVLNQTPSAFRQLMVVAQARPQRVVVRTVIFGGERLTPSELHGWQAQHPETQLVNMYGITEITVHGTYRALSAADLASATSMIGTGLPDLQLYVCEAPGRLAPTDVAGELYVGGAGVARGYVHRPGLTAARFVPDPFGPVAGARLYRTGDRVRRHADGSLEFLGRVDDQVKIRGYRIELGEIETVLRAHAGVQDAVVALHGSDPEQCQLVAYVTARPGRVPPRAAELRSHLEVHLPEYMVPSAYMAIDAIPITANGKVDRGALPALDDARPDAADEYVAPTTAVEEVLCKIWAHVLGLDQVGIHDDFFDFGGHSLRATQVISQVRRIFGIGVELRYLLEAPTVASFAAIVNGLHTRQHATGGARLDDVARLTPNELEALLSQQTDRE